jgi:hypothetical protein
MCTLASRFNTGSFQRRLIDSKIEMVPVDVATRSMARIIQQPEALGRVFHMNHPDAITDAAFAEWIRLRLSCSTSSRSPLDATDESWLRRRGFLRCCAHHTVVKSSATSLRQSPIRDQDTEDRYVVCDVSVFNRQGDLLVVALAVQR